MASDNDKKKKTERPSEIDLIYPEQINNLYSNNVQFFIGVSDVIFDFFAIEPRRVNKTKNLRASFQTRVVMSPQHAKLFALKLMENMEKYEETFGKLNLEPKGKK